ncbi:MAG: DUF6314 family protein [Pseudomonadota bacterium]
MERATASDVPWGLGGAQPGAPGSADWLMGRWRLRRVIHDRRLARTGRVDGALTVSPCLTEAGRLVVDEAGEMQLGGATYSVSRRSLWTPEGDGAIALTFEDGRPFHTIRPRAGFAVARHECAADLYEVVYRFGQGRWSSLWTVSGAAKNYTMASVMTRS